MQKRIRQYTVFSWAQDFYDSMIAIKKIQEKRMVNFVTPVITSEIVKSFSTASRRAIFLDYDGTLVPFSRIPELAIPEPETIDQLRRLTGSPKNTVVLVSGRDKNFLGEWFSAVDVHLIAEHGAFHKTPHGEWQTKIDPDQSWKAAFMPVLQRAINKCKGSFIEEKFSSLAWHFRNSPADIGSLKAKELTAELRTLVSHENNLQILEGNKVVEIKRSGYNKGVAALNFISNAGFDCIVALGDDRTDEDIFRSLPQDSITIAIGIRTSMAKYNLRNQLEVKQFIGRLIGI
jgi:trehalose 6-phosphate synthase/phosphatase